MAEEKTGVNGKYGAVGGQERKKNEGIEPWSALLVCQMATPKEYWRYRAIPIGESTS